MAKPSQLSVAVPQSCPPPTFRMSKLWSSCLPTSTVPKLNQCLASSWLAIFLASAGACERAQDWQAAAAVADEALALYRKAGDPYGMAAALAEQGFYDMVHGRLERSEQRLGEAVDLRRQLGDDRRLVEPLIDNAWLDFRGHPATDALHLVERYRRRDFGHLEIQFTIDDAKAYRQPWSVTMTFDLLPDTELIEHICENERDAAHIVGN